MKTEMTRGYGLAPRRRTLTALVALLTGIVAGCPSAPNPGGGLPGDFEDGNVDETVQSSLGKTSGEPNDSFDDPVVAVFDGSGLAQLKGTVASSGDFDVFLLGAINAGDRIIADAFAVTNLDISIAIFDSQGRLVADNDDRSDQNLDSHLDFAARHEGDPYFLVISRSAFASSRRTTGAYTADVQIETGREVPAPVAQTLFLKFDGGTVDSPRLGQMELDPFDAGAISRIYAGKSDEIKQVIVEVMRENYERFQVLVVSSDDATPDPYEEFSTVFFGGFDEDAFGIAENVDLYNFELCDDAIIFTESFSPFFFSQAPSAEEMGTAIGNVASHEVGHLLGLNHVDDDIDLMDTESPADAFLFDQRFKESPLSPQIAPLGSQDGVLLLNEIVGPADADASRLVQNAKSQSLPVSAGGMEVVRRQSSRSAKSQPE